MAAVMAVQAALIFQVEHKTAVARASGIAAAAMLFVFQGAFTIGFQATVWVSDYFFDTSAYFYQKEDQSRIEGIVTKEDMYTDLRLAI